MAKFRMAPEVLAHLLDLPEGTELGVIERVPIGDGKSIYEVVVTGEGWPDGTVELHYAVTDGVVSLQGFSPA